MKANLLSHIIGASILTSTISLNGMQPSKNLGPQVQRIQVKPCTQSTYQNKMILEKRSNADCLLSVCLPCGAITLLINKCNALIGKNTDFNLKLFHKLYYTEVPSKKSN